MLFSVPALSEWNPMRYTMGAYILQGVVIIVLNMPLIWILLFRKQNRERKEFVLIACVSIIDIFYVLVNAWNSFVRLTTSDQLITRADCIIQPMYFISLVASQLVANMPLMVAFDRLIATVFGVWYYKQRYFYSLVLVAIPIVFSFFVTLINLGILLTTDAGSDKVPAFCFTSTLPAPAFKYTYHSIKWFCIVLAGIVYLIVAFMLRAKVQYYAGIPNYSKRIRIANIVMGLTTINSVLFHLIPDFLLVVPLPFLSITVFAQGILYSVILEKIMFNFVIFLIFHTELRTLYFRMFFRGQPKTSVAGSSGGVATATSRMFTKRSDGGVLSRVAFRMSSCFTQ